MNPALPTDDAQPSPTAPRAPRHSRPATGISNDWLFPIPASTTLANGMAVDAFHLPGQHVIAADLTIGAPLEAEPRSGEGAATLVMRTSDEGTLSHPGAELTELLENSGAVYGGSVGQRTTACTLDVPSTRLAQALPLLAELVREPQLASADIERHRALRLAQIQQAAASGPSVAARALREVEYAPELRRSRASGGTTSTVRALTREQVVDFHADWWGPQNARLTIAGDLGVGVMPLIEQAFGDWQPSRRTAGGWVDDPTRPVERGVVHMVDRPGAVQADLRIAGVGVAREHEDWPALQVAGVAVGGSFLSRLNQRLREELGYTYGISLGVAPQRTTGRWQVATSVRTEVAAPALAEILTLLQLDQPLTDEEIGDARDQLVGLAPLQYETAAAVVGQASRLTSVGLGPEEVNVHFEQVLATTTAHADAAFRRHIGEPGGHVVVVGDADALAAPLAAAGWTVRPMQLDVED